MCGWEGGEAEDQGWNLPKEKNNIQKQSTSHVRPQHASGANGLGANYQDLKKGILWTTFG